MKNILFIFIIFINTYYSFDDTLNSEKILHEWTTVYNEIKVKNKFAENEIIIYFNKLQNCINELNRILQLSNSINHDKFNTNYEEILKISKQINTLANDFELNIENIFLQSDHLVKKLNGNKDTVVDTNKIILDLQNNFKSTYSESQNLQNKFKNLLDIVQSVSSAIQNFEKKNSVDGSIDKLKNKITEGISSLNKVSDSIELIDNKINPIILKIKDFTSQCNLTNTELLQLKNYFNEIEKKEIKLNKIIADSKIASEIVSNMISKHDVLVDKVKEMNVISEKMSKNTNSIFSDLISKSTIFNDAVKEINSNMKLFQDFDKNTFKQFNKDAQELKKNLVDITKNIPDCAENIDLMSKKMILLNSQNEIFDTGLKNRVENIKELEGRFDSISDRYKEINSNLSQIEIKIKEIEADEVMQQKKLELDLFLKQVEFCKTEIHNLILKSNEFDITEKIKLISFFNEKINQFHELVANNPEIEDRINLINSIDTNKIQLLISLIEKLEDLNSDNKGLINKLLESGNFNTSPNNESVLIKKLSTLELELKNIRIMIPILCGITCISFFSIVYLIIKQNNFNKKKVLKKNC